MIKRAGARWDSWDRVWFMPGDTGYDGDAWRRAKGVVQAIREEALAMGEVGE